MWAISMKKFSQAERGILRANQDVEHPDVHAYVNEEWEKTRLGEGQMLLIFCLTSVWFGLVWFLCLMTYQLFLGYLMPKPFS